MRLQFLNIKIQIRGGSLIPILRNLKSMAPKQTQRQECIIYTRVVGWLTPTKNWNKGKRAEYEDRRAFKVDNI